MRKQYLLSLLLTLILFLTGCSREEAPVSKSGLYFNTVITITLYDTQDNSILEQCFAIADTYEQLFSPSVQNSDIYRINHSNGQPVTVSPETIFLLQTAGIYSELTNGRIDVTVGPLSSLWNFTEHTLSDNPVPPTEPEIAAALTHVNYRGIHIDESRHTVSLSDADAALDPGFIAKGYIADRIKDYLLSASVKSAVINLGGNVLTIGSKPDGSPFSIGLQKPFAAINTAITTVSVTDKSVVSSGVYERYFMYQDNLYHHILDAVTGYPVQNELLGVTIISDSSMTGDALSTTCLILGLEQGTKLIQNSEEALEAIFITSDMKIHHVTSQSLSE